jgi:hypothetical protein
VTLSRAIILNAGKLSSWLSTPRHAADIWFGKWSVAVAWLGLLFAALTLPHGLGVPLCWFQSSTGIPCPGCGLTRSVSCAMRGMLFESCRYHPMGLLVLMLFLVTALQSILPNNIQKRLRRFIEAKPRWSKGFYLAFVTTFLAFGTLRALFHIEAAWFP